MSIAISLGKVCLGLQKPCESVELGVLVPSNPRDRHQPGVHKLFLIPSLHL